MIEAWLIGGKAAHTRIELDSELPLVLPLSLPDGETINYHYVGDLVLHADKTVRVFRHDSIRAEEITSFVRLKHTPLSPTHRAARGTGQSGFSPSPSRVSLRYE